MHRNKLFLSIAFCIFPLITKSQDYCKFIENIQNYQDSVKLKSNGEHQTIDSNSFNVHTYLSYFDNVTIENGFKIDVYFFDNFLDGNPYLYALKENQKIDNKDKESLYNILNKKELRAKNHIIPKDSIVGFIQYLFFSEMGEQFALKWHSNYNQKRIVCSSEALSRVINELSKSEMFTTDSTGLMKLKEVPPEIVIEKSDKDYTVTWIENRTHSGIFKCSYQINRHRPYDIIKTKEDKLLQIYLNFIY